MANHKFKGLTITVNSNDNVSHASSAIDRMIGYLIKDLNAEFIFSDENRGMDIVKMEPMNGSNEFRKTLANIRERLNQGQTAVVYGNSPLGKIAFCELKGVSDSDSE